MKTIVKNKEKPKKLTGRQEKVLFDMFQGDKNLDFILKKHNVSFNKYLDWQSEPAYLDAFDKWILSSRMTLAAYVSVYSQYAMSVLMELTGSEKTETARKACLDIINLSNKEKKEETAPLLKSGNRLLVSSNTQDADPLWTEERASAVLAALASEKK